MAVAFINRMYDALKRDDEAVKAERPALAKLKMLDEVCEVLTSFGCHQEVAGAKYSWPFIRPESSETFARTFTKFTN